MLDTPAALGQAGGDPGWPSQSAGSAAGALVGQPAASVAGALAGAAVPPARGPPLSASRDHCGLLALCRRSRRQLCAEPVDENFATGINLGRDITQGPGSDFSTQNEIVKSQSTPQHIAPGDTLLINPRLGANAPGNIASGGDPGQVEADKASLLDAQKDADMRVNLANTARNNQNDLETARQLYKTAGAIGDDDVGAALSDETLKWLSDRSGFNLNRFSKGADVRAAVGNFLKGQLGSVAQQIQGDPSSPMRGVVQQFNAYIPDPSKMSAEQFDWAVNMMEKGQDRLIEEGGPARAFQIAPKSAANAQAYNAGLEALRAKRDADARTARAAPGPAAAQPPAASQVYVFPDEATLNAAGTAGSVPDGSKVQIGYGANSRTGIWKK